MYVESLWQSFNPGERIFCQKGDTEMMQILGSEKRLCGAITRRDLLQIGGISALGLGLNSPTSTTAAPASHLTGEQAHAKSCIFVFLFGSPPQHETFDPKPLAAAEI